MKPVQELSELVTITHISKRDSIGLIELIQDLRLDEICRDETMHLFKYRPLNDRIDLIIIHLHALMYGRISDATMKSSIVYMDSLSESELVEVVSIRIPSVIEWCDRSISERVCNDRLNKLSVYLHLATYNLRGR